MILSRHGVSVLYGLSAWGVLAISMFLVPLLASTDTVSFVTVRTRAPSNPNPRIWYRVPCDYRATPGRTWRTLVIFGGRNCGGSNEVSNTIDWADMGGLGYVNFMLAWLIFVAFLATGTWLAVGRRYGHDVVCVAYKPYHVGKLMATITAVMLAIFLTTPTTDVPKVRHGFVVKEGHDMPLVLHGEEWTLKAVVDYMSAPDGSMPDGYRLAMGSGYMSPDTSPASVWLFGTVVEAAHRFPDVPTTAVSPPEFCNLPSKVRILQ